MPKLPHVSIMCRIPEKLRDLLAVYSFNLGTSRNAIITAAITRYLKDNLTSREVILEHINAIELLEDKKIGFDQTVVSIPEQVQCKKELTEVLRKEQVTRDITRDIARDIANLHPIKKEEPILDQLDELLEETNTMVEIKCVVEEVHAPTQKSKQSSIQKMEIVLGEMEYSPKVPDILGTVAPVKKEKKPKTEKVLVEHSIPIVSEKEEDIILDDLDFSDLDK